MSDWHGLGGPRPESVYLGYSDDATPPLVAASPVPPVVPDKPALAPKTSSFLHFDGMTWPNPDDPNEIIWKAKYGDFDSVRHIIASYASAYIALVGMPQRRRNAVIADLRSAGFLIVHHTKET